MGLFRKKLVTKDRLPDDKSRADGSTPPVPRPQVKRAQVHMIKATPKIRDISELPPHRGVLSAEGGTFDLVLDAVREAAVILQQEDGKVAVVWTGDSKHRMHYGTAVDILLRAGVKIDNKYLAPLDVIAVLYDVHKRSKNSIAQRQDAEQQSVVPSGGKDDMRILLDKIILSAVRLAASDVHLEVSADQAVIRFRVHGELRKIKTLPRSRAEALSRAMFARANPDGKDTTFAPKDFQDAQISLKDLKIEGKPTPVNLRFASMPIAPDGWDIVLRLLMMDVTSDTLALPQLGYDEAQVTAFDRMLAKPVGLTLLCGTTGSGKSTTLKVLLGMLDARARGTRKIRTIEDPVEYMISGARQTPVMNVPDENGFAKALKAAMRADPDTIMVGEIRDEVSAQLVQRATQTGHKVLTTVHASNPFEAIHRLVDLGVERPVATADSFLNGVIYQKLLPVLCPDCSHAIHEVQEHLSQDVIKRINVHNHDKLDTIRFRGSGCSNCSKQGVTGRTVVASMLVPDRSICQMLADDRRMDAHAWWRGGFSTHTVNGFTAMDHALTKMREGLVSPLDVEHELGYLDDEESKESVREWAEKNHLFEARS